MKPYQTVKKVLASACVYNTVAILLLYSFGRLLPNGSGLIPKLSHMYMILLFSVALSIANSLLRVKKINAFFRIMIHYVCVTAIFYLIFIVWGNFAANGSVTIVVMLAYTVVYFILTAICALVRRNAKSDTDDSNKEEYESQFSARIN